MRSLVGEPEARVPAEVSFEGEVPLLRVRHRAIDLVASPEVGIAHRGERAETGAERIGERQLRLSIHHRVVISASVGGVDAGQRIKHGSKNCYRVDSVPAANHRAIAPRPIGEAKARQEIIRVGAAEPFGQARLLRRDNRRIADRGTERRRSETKRGIVRHDHASAGRIPIEVGKLQRTIPEWLLDLVAQAVVERQLAVHLPIVLRVIGVVNRRAVDIGARVGHAGALRETEEIVGEGIAAEHAIEPVLTEVVAGEERYVVGGAQAFDVNAEFEGVLAAGPRQVVGELVVKAQLREAARAARARKAGNAEIGNAGHLGRIRTQSLDAQLLHQRRAVVGLAVGAKVHIPRAVREAKAELVHHRGTDHVVVGGGQGARANLLARVAQRNQRDRRLLHDVLPRIANEDVLLVVDQVVAPQVELVVVVGLGQLEAQIGVLDVVAGGLILAGMKGVEHSA